MAWRLVSTKPLSEPMLEYNWTLRNKIQWNFNRNSNIFMQENVSENVFCKMVAILSQPQCVKNWTTPQVWLPWATRDWMGATRFLVPFQVPYYFQLLWHDTMRETLISGRAKWIQQLTHWVWDKMAAIFQTTLSNAFSWMKMYEFWLRFHLSLFLRVQVASHYLDQWWSIYWCIYTSFGIRPRWVNNDNNIFQDVVKPCDS